MFDYIKFLNPEPGLTCRCGEPFTYLQTKDSPLRLMETYLIRGGRLYGFRSRVEWAMKNEEIVYDAGKETIIRNWKIFFPLYLSPDDIKPKIWKATAQCKKCREFHHYLISIQSNGDVDFDYCEPEKED